LLDALLDFWARDMTDNAIAAAREFSGSPAERIFFIMQTVMTHSLARIDLAVWHWAQSDANADRSFKRVLKKRLSFAAWMFSEPGFSKEQAKIRGQMMVVHMIGELTLMPDSISRRKDLLRLNHETLLAQC